MSKWISSRAVVMRVNGRLCKNNKLQGCLFFNYFPHYFFPFVKFGTVFDTTLVFTPFRALHVKVIENSGHWLLTGKYLNSLIYLAPVVRNSKKTFYLNVSQIIVNYIFMKIIQYWKENYRNYNSILFQRRKYIIPQTNWKKWNHAAQKILKFWNKKSVYHQRAWTSRTRSMTSKSPNSSIELAPVVGNSWKTWSWPFGLEWKSRFFTFERT